MERAFFRQVFRQVLGKYPWIYFVIAAYVIFQNIYDLFQGEKVNILVWIAPAIMIALGIYEYYHKRKIEQTEKERDDKNIEIKQEP